uniref:Uncharacterized protein n=1 Tax=Anguilla anguilla TaxID=7936 RepID=A0A0E9VPZ7_ANGAN
MPLSKTNNLCCHKQITDAIIMWRVNERSIWENTLFFPPSSEQ